MIDKCWYYYYYYCCCGSGGPRVANLQMVGIELICLECGGSVRGSRGVSPNTTNATTISITSIIIINGVEQIHINP